jgi:hypothetical protein
MSIVPTEALSMPSPAPVAATVAADFYSIERAGRLMARYGVADMTVASALSEIRDQLRTGVGPARQLAIAAARKEAERSAAQSRSANVHAIEERLRDVLLPVPREAANDSDEWRWVSDFGSAIAPVVEDATEWSDAELLQRFHGYVAAELEKLAANCICGHHMPHRQGVGCMHRRCGCGSPARARRAEEDVERVRALSINDLLGAWPSDA